MKHSTIPMLLVLLLTTSTLGHSGGTDSRGGHNDRIHGGYHYHHGMGPHQHPGGVCPYGAGSSSLKWLVGGAIALGGLFIYVKWNQWKASCSLTPREQHDLELALSGDYEFSLNITEDRMCPKCCYNLRGARIGNRCPECARVIPPVDDRGPFLRHFFLIWVIATTSIAFTSCQAPIQSSDHAGTIKFLILLGWIIALPVGGFIHVSLVLPSISWVARKKGFARLVETEQQIRERQDNGA